MLRKGDPIRTVRSVRALYAMVRRDLNAARIAFERASRGGRETRSWLLAAVDALLHAADVREIARERRRQLGAAATCEACRSRDARAIAQGRRICVECADALPFTVPVRAIEAKPIRGARMPGMQTSRGGGA